MEWHSVFHWVVNISLFDENVNIVDIVETDVIFIHDVMFILNGFSVVVKVFLLKAVTLKRMAMDFHKDISKRLMGTFNLHQNTSIKNCWEESSNIAP